MKIHKFYYTDQNGNFDGYKVEKLTIDLKGKRPVLNISDKLRIPICEILSVELRPLKTKGVYLAIDVLGASVKHKLTTLPFIHKNFFAITKVSVMQDFIDEISPLIEGNKEKIESNEIKYQESLNTNKNVNAQNTGIEQFFYSLNVSFFVGFYHKQWFSFDTNTKAIKKTITLMLIGGIVNILGLLLIAVPYYNYKMMKNLKLAGWSSKKSNLVYFITTYPCYFFWIYIGHYTLKNVVSH